MRIVRRNADVAGPDCCSEKLVLRQQLELRRLAVDDLEQHITRLQLPVWQERRIAKHRSLDGLAADGLRNRLAIEALGGFDGARPDLTRSSPQCCALVGLHPVSLLDRKSTRLNSSHA